MLPIQIKKNSLFLDLDKSIQVGAKDRKKYKSASPFPHIVIDNFLPVKAANLLLEKFPMHNKKNNDQLQGNYFEHNKKQTSPYDCHQEILNYFLFFNSTPFLSYLKELTGIDGLIPDPHFRGGGCHEIIKGGKLGIHADFRINKELHLERRINVLIYLNKDWKDSFGGNLELWNKKMTSKIHSVKPIFNRCVIFNTDSDAFHGHPEPLNTPEGVSRKSIALYYYSASKHLYKEIPALTTQFQSRNNDEKKELRMHKKLKKQIVESLLPPIVFSSIRATVIYIRDLLRMFKGR